MRLHFLGMLLALALSSGIPIGIAKATEDLALPERCMIGDAPLQPPTEGNTSEALGAVVEPLILNLQRAHAAGR